MNALALEAAAGSRAAFSRLVSENYDLIHRVALKWSGNRDDAEDIAQTVCVKLGQAIRSFRGEAKFSTWLYRLTINAAQDHHRARARDTARTQAFMAQALVEAQP
ncbi:MAG: RNA polymerase sigma factor, partial [Notoacmeibacter sp.]|nr:RNA polymerase sigma factor [Notoacmeibacter sp.]